MNTLRTKIATLLLLGCTFCAVPSFGQILETYIVPVPEDQMNEVNVGIAGSRTTPSDEVRSVISIVGNGNGTIVYYDHWEDGYEVDLANPVQSTTEIWGDGDDSNGIPPGFSSDVVNAGDIVNLDNTVDYTDLSPIDYDGRDKIGTTVPLAVTRAAWHLTPGEVLAGAVEVQNVEDLGSYYVAPFGEDTDPDAGSFKVAYMNIMATLDGTVVDVDVDADGIVDSTTMLNEGEAFLVTDFLEGASVNANFPVQTTLMVGNDTRFYELRWFRLTPRDQWIGTYCNPIGTTSSGAGAFTYLFNPGDEAITVEVATTSGKSFVDVPAGTSLKVDVPEQSGSCYVTPDGEPFYAAVIIDPAQSHDWGMTLIPECNLSSQLLIGWGPGSGDLSQNGSPVWVTAKSDTTLLIDYDGDPATGAMTDPNGNQFDEAIDMLAYEMVRIFDAGDNDQTGMRVYTLDGVLLSAAWGQDPDNASAGNPFLDMGTTVLPVPIVSLRKQMVLSDDQNQNGEIDPGDTLRITLDVINSGLSSLVDVTLNAQFDPDLEYVAGSTTMDGVPVADDASGASAFPYDESVHILGNLDSSDLFQIEYDLTLQTSFNNCSGLLENPFRYVATANKSCAGNKLECFNTRPIKIRQDLAIEAGLVNGTCGCPNQDVEIEITVRNAGNTVLNDIEVVSTYSECDRIIPELFQGQTHTYTCLVNTAVSGSNVVTASADPCGTLLADTVSAALTLDFEAPTFTVPADTSAECGHTDPSITGDVVVQDNCDDAPVATYTDTFSGSCPSELRIVREWTIMDACGNAVTDVQTIALVDTTPPVVTCPDASSFPGLSCGSPLPDLQPEVSDNCSKADAITITQDPPAGTVFDAPGTYPVVLTATDACGNQTNCSVDITVLCSENPSIGLAKALDSVEDNGDGTYRVVYRFTMRNYGDVDLSALELFDDIPGQFAGLSPSGFIATAGSLAANPDWDGSAASNLLAPGQGLAVGASGDVLAAFDVAPSGPTNVENIATVQGLSPAGTPVSDESTNGLDPDPDADGVPSENVPTPVSFPPPPVVENPSIGLAKALDSVEDNGDGTYRVVYRFTMRNYGDVDLSALELFDDIPGQFAGLSPSGFIATAGSLAANPDWDGSAASNLLAPGQGLAVGASGDVLAAFDVAPSGPTNVENIATVQGLSPAGTPVSDESTNGLDPDPDADGVPSENVPTPVSFPPPPVVESPSIGLAKALERVLDHGDGTYRVVYRFTMRNYGDVDLSALELFDDIPGQFAGLSPSGFIATAGSLAANPDWDGSAASNILAPGQRLAVGASGDVLAAFDVAPSGPTNVENIATVQGLSPEGTPVSDESTNGLDPDPDADGVPSENVPTVVTLPPPPVVENPSIGLAKALERVEDNGDGTYRVVYRFTMSNYGDVDLSALELFDDIPGQFAGLSPSGFIATAGSLSANPDWDGSAASNILAPGQGLAVGASGDVIAAFDVAPTGPTTVENIATVQGLSPEGTPVSDMSTNGLDPDPDADGVPSENVPTVVTLPPPPVVENPSLGLAKALERVEDNGDGTYRVVYRFTMSNYGDVDLSGLELFDDIPGQFAGLSPSGYAATAGSLSANPDWDGSAASNILAPGQRLAVGASGDVIAAFDVAPTGPTTVENIATVQGLSPEGTPVSDESTNGLDPDPDADGVPSENVPTPVTFPPPPVVENPSIGLAKATESVENLGDGGYRVTYRFTLANDGDVDLSALELFDDISSQFAGLNPIGFSTVSGSLSSNPDWDGSAGSNILGPGQRLAVGASGDVLASFVVTPGGTTNVDNIATVHALSPLGTPVSDASTDGLDPDPNLDGVPAEDLPTPTPFVGNPGIGLAKDLSDLVHLDPERVQIEFLFTVVNSGDLPLDSVTITDDVRSLFAVWSPTDFVAFDGTLLASDAWDGGPDANVLAPNLRLLPGESGTVGIRFAATPAVELAIDNVAVATGTPPDGTLVRDDSTDGLEVDPDGEGTPSENTPTTVVAPIADLSLIKSVNTTMPFVGDTIVYSLLLRNDGPSPATGVTVEERLPAGLRYLSDSGAGSYANGIWNVGTIESGATTQLDIEVQITTSEPIVNTAHVESSEVVDPDSVPGNDDPTEDDLSSVTVTAVPLTSIRGVIWEDVDGDALPGEDLAMFGIPDVRVNLIRTEPDGSIIEYSFAATVIDGAYEITGVPPGDYEVVVDVANVPSNIRERPSTPVAYPVVVVGTEVTDLNFGFQPEATAIELEWLRAFVVDAGVEVVWQTAWEDNTLGFFVYRVSADGHLERVAKAITLATGGGEYRLLDAGATGGRYMIEEVTNDLQYELQSDEAIAEVSASPAEGGTTIHVADAGVAQFVAPPQSGNTLVLGFQRAPQVLDVTKPDAPRQLIGELLEKPDDVGVFFKHPAGASLFLHESK